MRDPNRIYEINNLFLKLWQNVPDWRFGQLLSNLLGFLYTDTKVDPFFIEDNDRLKELLNKYIEEYTPKYKEYDEKIINPK